MKIDAQIFLKGGQKGYLPDIDMDTVAIFSTVWTDNTQDQEACVELSRTAEIEVN